jgi:hypothetical protein
VSPKGEHDAAIHVFSICRLFEEHGEMKEYMDCFVPFDKLRVLAMTPVEIFGFIEC